MVGYTLDAIELRFEADFVVGKRTWQAVGSVTRHEQLKALQASWKMFEPPVQTAFPLPIRTAFQLKLFQCMRKMIHRLIQNRIKTETFQGRRKMIE